MFVGGLSISCCALWTGFRVGDPARGALALVGLLFLLALLMLFSTITGTVLPTSAAADDVAKVVYHADFADPRRFSAMLTSINNMVTYYQNELIEYDVRIVFVAHGIRFVTNDKLGGTPFEEDAAMAERLWTLSEDLTRDYLVTHTGPDWNDYKRAARERRPGKQGED